MKSITASDFTQLLLKGDILSSLEIKENVVATIQSNTSKSLENVVLKSLTLKSANKLVNSLHFSNCSIESLFLSDLSTKYLSFDSCSIKTLIFFSGSSDELRISNSQSDTISQYESIVLGKDIKQLAKLFIANVSIGKINLLGKIEIAKIENCSIKNIEGIGARNEFLLSKVIDGELFNLESENSAKTISIKECITSKILIKGCKVSQLNIYAGFIGEIELKPKACDEVTIRGISFFDENFGNQTPTHRIDKISVNNWVNIKNSAFSFAYLKLKEFSAHEINFINNALFDTITVTENFTIMDSTLIKCRFHKVRLNQCSIHLFNTFLQDCDFVNVKWPERHRINEAVDSHKEYESIREVYRQLKKVSLAQNDKIGALEFQTNEMHMHYLHLKTKQNKTLRDCGNFLIVGTHKWASDFGQNIWKPFLFLFGFHLFFFILLSVLQLQIYPAISGIDWHLTYEMLNAYFITILPTHKTELLLRGTLLNIGGWIDFVIRICSGYFIFYFIYSSRKYHQ